MKKILIGVIILSLIFSGCTEINDIEPNTACIIAEDCENRGLIHPMCVGEWQCIEGQCAWECSSEIANPASTNCIEENGELRIITESNGGQYGICVFDDGSYCEEWALFREECVKGKQKLECNEYALNESWKEKCNTCTCTETGIACTEMACPETYCNTIKDCDGLPHILCVGEWECNNNNCEFNCSSNKTGFCETANDCESQNLNHDACVGNWNCIENQCKWNCGEVNE
jgi:putative hemolysin